jgi:hypothetical protein
VATIGGADMIEQIVDTTMYVDAKCSSADLA